MKAHLDTKLELWEISVFTELAIWEKRPDLKILCTAASQNGSSLNKDVVSRCLPGLSDRACRNLIYHLKYIGLINNDEKLTSFGQQCAESGTAPSWEQGVYSLLVTRHPLFGTYVLGFKREAGDGKDKNFDDLKPLPPWFSIEKNKKFRSALDPSCSFSINLTHSTKLQNTTCRMRELDACTLKWEIDLIKGSNQWIIEGRIGDKQGIHFKLSPQSVDPHKLINLYPDWEPRWNVNRKFLAMAYDGGAQSSGVDNFLRSFQYKNKNVGPLGEFEHISVTEVPVGPSTDNHARRWAAALFASRLTAMDSYISPKKWSAEWSSVVARTPLESGAGEAPHESEFLKLVGRPLSARNHRLFFAAVDIGMEV